MKVWGRLLAVALLALPGGAVVAQAPGTVSGKVTDAASGQPVQAAQISGVGTNICAITNEAGQYTIRGVPARQVTLRVLRVGYSEQTQLVTVASGGAATADFQLRQVSVNLAPVGTTATGETRADEDGSAISHVDAAKTVETSPVANINDLLNSRAPGVQLLTSGATGAGARVRIRGTNSLSLSNDPVYIVDGIRIEASSNGQRAQAIGLGGTVTSRLNDINPEEIETIEVIKGPSAATLYGTDAANGVIVITTKRGKPGPTEWKATVEEKKAP
jgi:TonB-dependent SusC/RagA subfamily outer membrane receptor